MTAQFKNEGRHREFRNRLLILGDLHYDYDNVSRQNK
jgi:hypothetical protein